MKENIGVELLRSSKVNAREKAFEIYDTKLKGFTLKIYPDTVSKNGDTVPGAKTYLVRYRLPDGRQTRTVIGRHTLFTAYSGRIRPPFRRESGHRSDRNPASIPIRFRPPFRINPASII